MKTIKQLDNHQFSEEKKMPSTQQRNNKKILEPMSCTAFKTKKNSLMGQEEKPNPTEFSTISEKQMGLPCNQQNTHILLFQEKSIKTQMTNSETKK